MTTPQDTTKALANLLKQVQDFIAENGEADFYTGEAEQALLSATKQPHPSASSPQDIIDDARAAGLQQHLWLNAKRHPEEIEALLKFYQLHKQRAIGQLMTIEDIVDEPIYQSNPISGGRWIGK